MNYNHKKFLLLLITLFLVAAILIYITKKFNSLGVFVFDFSLAFAVIFITLMRVSKNIFVKWLKFAAIFLLLSVIIILITPETGSDFIFSIDRKVVTFGLSVLFTISSVIVILSKKY